MDGHIGRGRSVSPDTAETRIRELEREMSALRTKVEDLSDDVKRTQDIYERLARIEEIIAQLKKDTDHIFTRLREDRKAAEEREAKLTEEIDALRDVINLSDKSTRKLIVWGCLSIGGSFCIGGAGVVVSQLLGG
jgi:uncharacterized protein involved in exopolysaccharide biosynthesis